MQRTPPIIGIAYRCHLKRLREQRGLTQEKVGEYLGCRQAIISKYESGQVVIPTKYIAPLLLLFECSIDALMEFR